VKVRITSQESDVKRWKEAGTFYTVGELRAGSDPAWISKGSEVGMDEIKSLTKTKESLDKPLFTGVLSWEMEADGCLGNTFLAEYNKELKGWHYAWCGAKQQKEPHTFTSYMFIESGPGKT
jgi:hypothetical protein